MYIRKVALSQKVVKPPRSEILKNKGEGWFPRLSDKINI